MLHEVVDRHYQEFVSQYEQKYRETYGDYRFFGSSAASANFANEVACIGLQAFFNSVSTGVSVVETLANVEHAIIVRGTGIKGARRVRGFAQVATGAADSSIGYRLMEITTKRPLEEGDLAPLELGSVVDGYWADRTCVRVAGEPTSTQKELHIVVMEAQETAF